MKMPSSRKAMMAIPAALLLVTGTVVVVYTASGSEHVHSTKGSPKASAALAAHHQRHHEEEPSADDYGHHPYTHVHHVYHVGGAIEKAHHAVTIDNGGPEYGQIEYGHKADRTYYKPTYNPNYKMKLAYTVPTGKTVYKNTAHTEYKRTYHTVMEPKVQYKTVPYKEYKEYTRKVPHIYYKKVPHTKVTYTNKKVPYETYHLKYQKKKVPYATHYTKYRKKMVRHTVTTIKPYTSYVPVTKMKTKIVQVPKTVKYTKMVPTHVASTQQVNYTVEYPKTEYISSTRYVKKTKMVPHKVSHTEYRDKTVLIPHIKYKTAYKKEPVVTTHYEYYSQPYKVPDIKYNQEIVTVTHNVTTEQYTPQYKTQKKTVMKSVPEKVPHEYTKIELKTVTCEKINHIFYHAEAYNEYQKHGYAKSYIHHTIHTYVEHDKHEIASKKYATPVKNPCPASYRQPTGEFVKRAAHCKVRHNGYSTVNKLVPEIETKLVTVNHPYYHTEQVTEKQLKKIPYTTYKTHYKEVPKKYATVSYKEVAYEVPEKRYKRLIKRVPHTVTTTVMIPKTHLVPHTEVKEITEMVPKHMTKEVPYTVTKMVPEYKTHTMMVNKAVEYPVTKMETKTYMVPKQHYGHATYEKEPVTETKMHYRTVEVPKKVKDTDYKTVKVPHKSTYYDEEKEVKYSEKKVKEPYTAYKRVQETVLKPKQVPGKKTYTTVTSQPYTEVQHIVCVPKVRLEYSCACGGYYDGGSTSSAYKSVDELGEWLNYNASKSVAAGYANTAEAKAASYDNAAETDVTHVYHTVYHHIVKGDKDAQKEDNAKDVQWGYAPVTGFYAKGHEDSWRTADATDEGDHATGHHIEEKYDSKDFYSDTPSNDANDVKGYYGTDSASKAPPSDYYGKDEGNIVDHAKDINKKHGYTYGEGASETEVARSERMVRGSSAKRSGALIIGSGVAVACVGLVLMVLAVFRKRRSQEQQQLSEAANLSVL